MSESEQETGKAEVSVRLRLDLDGSMAGKALALRDLAESMRETYATSDREYDGGGMGDMIALAAEVSQAVVEACEELAGARRGHGALAMPGAKFSFTDSYPSDGHPG